MRSDAAGLRTGGYAAILGAMLRLAIVVAYATTGLGAAGHLSFGSFSRLIFVPSLALLAAGVAMYRVFGEAVDRRGRLGLAAAVAGLAAVALGQLGGEWMSFPRSGNYFIGPGTISTMLGLGLFGLSARSLDVGRSYSWLCLSIATFPIVYFAVAASVEVLMGSTVPPSLHDNYFRALYAIVSFFWLGIGVALLRDSGRASS